ncbi:hypothetical protein MKI84_04520 [Ancylobacter sp. A5.8]|uniref:hypothetical protein n=1 Tax=Ancylobacter gelatini TaxID=2919920 RepID=UPI001F4EDA32|nr:hypothetical protein [Ancylobacter gelatini]MCJ8142173.1 hypothetical protein [Ancylobacter gelatini]
MDINFRLASQLVDDLEVLLERHEISIPKDPVTQIDMLSTWRVLRAHENKSILRPVDERPLLASAAMLADQAAKILAVKEHPDFPKLLPHLNKLSEGAINIGLPPTFHHDASNKFSELYWACLCMAKGDRVEVDDPDASSGGTNPDVIAISGGRKIGYALKTVRSKAPMTLFENLEKAVDQIERADVDIGFPVLNLTPQFELDEVWPLGFSWPNYIVPGLLFGEKIKGLLADMCRYVGGSSMNELFEGKKSVPACVAFCFAPTSVIHDTLITPVSTSLKIMMFIILTDADVETVNASEIKALNDVMQSIVGQHPQSALGDS